MKQVVGNPCGKRPNMLAVGAILLLVVLLSGMALVLAIHVGGTVQQQQTQQVYATSSKSRKKEPTPKQ
jgi:hypothetical protein